MAVVLIGELANATLREGPTIVMIGECLCGSLIQTSGYPSVRPREGGDPVLKVFRIAAFAGMSEASASAWRNTRTLRQSDERSQHRDHRDRAVRGVTTGASPINKCRLAMRSAERDVRRQSKEFHCPRDFRSAMQLQISARITGARPSVASSNCTADRSSARAAHRQHLLLTAQSARAD